LVYGYLTRRRGYNRRQIHSNIVGSYSNVLKEYPNEVRAQRARANHTSACLIVVIDADVGTVENRHQQLASKLDEVGADPRRDAERIAHVVPRRNVETWIVALCGGHADETTDYPRQPAERRKVAADSLCATNIESVPSLTRGCQELSRLS
ncbi:MAG: hypothetical protein IT379_26180, partial [Deltaproteobacteria bacterium]|nr:hypothetical protein [Deltaproteobacteria bacterium]